MVAQQKDIWSPSEEWEFKDFGGLHAYSAKDILSRTGHNLALYGQGGAGKTTCAATVRHSQHCKRVLHLDCAGNAHVLAHDPNYKVVPVTSWKEINDFNKACRNTVDLPFDCVVFDNMSEMQEMNMLTYCGIPGTEEIQHWRRNTADILAMTRMWKDLTRVRPVSVIFIAWEDEVINDKGQVMKHSLKFSKALRASFPGIVDNVAYLTVEPDGVTRHMSFNPHKTDAKMSVAHIEAAHQIPFDIWYREQPVLAHVFDTVIDNTPFPRDLYPAVK